MAEHEQSPYVDERFTTLRPVQEALARRGFYLYPIEKEHTEGLVTSPLLHRLRTQIKKRGFRQVAGHVALTFSGYAHDQREVFAIPEARAWWQQLDTQLPELPALLAILPELRYNGAGMHLTLLGEIDAMVHRPLVAGYDVHVADAQRLIDAAVRRIRQAGRIYHLNQTAVTNLVEHFRRGALQRLT